MPRGLINLLRSVSIFFASCSLSAVYKARASYCAVTPLTTERNCGTIIPVSYTHLRAHETVLDLVCRLLLEKKKAANTAYVRPGRGEERASARRVRGVQPIS